MIHYCYYKQITVDHFDDIKKSLGRHRLKVALNDSSITEWFIATDSTTNAIVGCVAYMPVAGRARFKCDIVHRDFRGSGIYNELFKMRVAAATKAGYTEADAFAGPMSIGTFLRYGFEKKSLAKSEDTWYLLLTINTPKK